MLAYDRARNSAVRGRTIDYHHQEIDLVAAILRRAVDDARRAPKRQSEWHGNVIQADAVAFLRDTRRLACYAELIGVDVNYLQPLLLQQAGIQEE